jgi:GntR family phosphonate transport system transcriptional regulator
LSDIAVTTAPPADAAETSGAAPPAWRRIADDLTAAMARGDLKPGDALPTAIQLAERYAVHRHTVRQAFRYLAEQGRVSVQQGRGTFVIEPRLPYRIGRRVSFRANVAGSGKTTSGGVLDDSLIAAEGVIAERLRVPLGATLWRVRTTSSLDGAPMSTSVHYLDAARFPDFPTRLRAAGGSMTNAFARYGIAAYERLSTRLYARGATEEEADLLGLVVGAPVLHSSGLDGLPDGTPIQLAETAFPGERMEMVVEPE